MGFYLGYILTKAYQAQKRKSELDFLDCLQIVKKRKLTLL